MFGNQAQGVPKMELKQQANSSSTHRQAVLLTDNHPLSTSGVSRNVFPM